MKKEKIFASSIMMSTAAFALLTVFGFYGFYGFALFQDTSVLLWAIACVLTFVFAIVNIILHTIAAVKSRANGKIGKGLVVTNIVFEFLNAITSIIGSIFMIMLFNIFGAGIEGIIVYGFTMVFPAMLFAVVAIVAAIFNIVGIVGSKKAVEEQ